MNRQQYHTLHDSLEYLRGLYYRGTWHLALRLRSLCLL